MNFLERLEEGLGEESINVKNKHVRVSTYRRPEGDPHQSFLTEDTFDLAQSHLIEDPSYDNSAPTESKPASLAGYSHIDDSFFQHAAPQEKPPVKAKRLEEFKNSIYENFFGLNTTVTKLLNKDTNAEKIISKHS